MFKLVVFILLSWCTCSYAVERERELPEMEKSHWGEMLDAVSGLGLGSSRKLQDASSSPAPTFISEVVSSPPTEFPTESPAPSPSPSHFPTASPTGTPQPTGTPSAYPTESPAPSPSPSMYPSASPSKSPTDSPSASPSDQPTAAPTVSPTTSMAPTSSPTKTLEPTSSPTIGVAIMTSSINLLLENVESLIEGNEAVVFEEEAFQFITENIPKDDTTVVTVTSVQLADQALIVARRALQDERSMHQGGLSVDIGVVGEVSPKDPPADFSFTNSVGIGFATNYTAFENMLANGSDFFAPLTESKTSDAADTAVAAGMERDPTDDKGGDSGMSAAGAVAIIVGSVAALTLAVAASVISVRRRRSRNYIETSDGIDSDKVRMYGAREVSSSYFSPEKSVRDGASVEIEPKLQDPPLVPSPNTVENGGSRYCGVAEFADFGDNCTPGFMLKRALMDDDESQDTGNIGDQNLKEVEVMADETNEKASPKSPVKANMVLQDLRTLESMDEQSEFAPIETPNGVLGAMPLNDDNMETTAVEVSHEPRMGLYDVFAPPGPLGIVVDTSLNGPVIHSLKPKSSLKGLVSPGDIVVGLDDMDTRSMTAATLTRLMAKRADQQERKITLLAAGDEVTI